MFGRAIHKGLNARQLSAAYQSLPCKGQIELGTGVVLLTPIFGNPFSGEPIVVAFVVRGIDHKAGI